MKKPSMRWVIAGAALAVGALAAQPAAAHGRFHGHGPRVTFGFHFGAPVWPAYYYYPPAPVYYQPTPIVVQPASPPVYVERSDQNPAGYWYYCTESRAYYPYVKDCPGGWQRVSPTPPG